MRPVRKTSARFAVALAAALVAALALSARAQSAPHRAILISFDGFSEQRFREYSDSITAPNVWAMFRDATCAESVRPSFPSVTPAGHASIWTGTYGNLNGIAAQGDGALPLPATTILDTVDGFNYRSLRAEPLAIAAARQGKVVYAHMTTQSPFAPGYGSPNGPNAILDSARARATRTLAGSNIASLNTYNELVMAARAIRSTAELSWALGTTGDSLHARIRDDSTIVVQLDHDTSRTTTVRLAPVDTTSPRGRPLARFFSEPLRIDLPRGRRTFIFFRLFELSRDRSHLLLYVSEARVVQGNRPEVTAAYDAAVRGVPGNGGNKVLERGELGPRVQQGGAGLAEYRYFETAELVMRQFMRGTEWGWRTYHPELALDYTPYPDEALHAFLGYADPAAPNVTPAARENAARMLKRTYVLVDLRVEQMRRLAASEPNTRLFVTGEHGMRPAWLGFRPNVALREAGLVNLDTAGKVDLARSVAAAAIGGWISVNRTTRKGGIVPPDSVDAVLTRIERVLLAARDSAGTQIVTRTWRAGTVAGDSLGIGGPTGGDIYVGLAPGYYWGAVASGTMVVPMAYPQGEHGYPSIEHDMHPILCMTGGGTRAQRIGEVRSIDIAPSVADWLGISPPADARGRSLIKK